MKLERSLGPLASVLVHMVIIFALYHFISLIRNPPPDVAIITQYIELEPPPDLTPPEQPVEPEDVRFVIHKKVVDRLFTPPDESIDPPETNDPQEINTLDHPIPTVVKMDLPSLSKRRQGEQRDGAIRKYNPEMGRVTEQAVINALEWLRLNQEDDGSWKSSRPVGITGLAVLTYLAHGETTASIRYGRTVERAVKYLVAKQDARGLFDHTGHYYSHAIATYAMAEFYAMTRIPSAKGPMERGVSVIIEGLQSKELARRGSQVRVPGLDADSARTVTAGMWDYEYKHSDRWDLSFAGWQVQALKAAKLARSSHPKLDQALLVASNGIKAWQNPDSGRFGYSQPGSGSMAMSSVGTLCLQLMQQGKCEEARKGLRVLKDETCSFVKAGPAHPMYHWYYLTQVNFNAKDTSVFDAWNRQLLKAYLGNQNKDGSWDAPTGADGKAKEDQYGKAYPTTLAALTLMVYYRNQLATGKIDQAPPAAGLDRKDDIGVEVTDGEG